MHARASAVATAALSAGERRPVSASGACRGAAITSAAAKPDVTPRDLQSDRYRSKAADLAAPLRDGSI